MAAVACSGAASGPATTLPPGAPPVTEPAAVAAASFDAIRSDLIRTAAMKYRPIATSEPEAPLSLTASDGTGLRLVALDARAVVDGPLALTELRLRFENPRDRVVEGRFAITLPPGAAVSRLAMRIDGGWQEAEVVEKQQARVAYEDALHRRQDPALLEKEAGNEFRARIFPIPARGTKDLVVAYSEELPRSDSRYKLRLKGLPAVDRLHASVLLGGARADLSQDGKVPDKDFEAAVPQRAAGLRADEIVVARVKPAFPAESSKIGALAIAFDTSASRALGFAGEVERLGRLVDRLRKEHGDELALSVATFDQAVVPVYDGAAKGFGRAQLDRILARRPLGASDVAGALAWLGKAARGGRALLVTDTVATAGPTAAEELAAAARALRGSVDRIDVLGIGGIRDDEAAGRLVRGAVAKDGVVLDGALPDDEIASRMGRSTRSGIGVSVAGADWVWPARLDGVQPGDEVLVYAVLKRGALAPGKPLAVTLEGSLEQKIDIALATAARPLVERAAAAAEIARLSSMRSELPPGDKARRAELDERIVRTSTRWRVLSDATALLVLETDADYERFRIDRTALADILTVGDGGVEVMHRTRPVIAVVAQEPRGVATSGGGKRPIAANRAPSKPKVDAPKPAKKTADEGFGYEFSDDPGAPPSPAGGARAAAPPADAPAQAARGARSGDLDGESRQAARDRDGADEAKDKSGRAEPMASSTPRGMAPPRPSPAERPAAAPPPPATPAPARGDARPEPRPRSQPGNFARAPEAEDAAPGLGLAAPRDSRAPDGARGRSLWNDTQGASPYSGRMADVMRLVEERRTEAAVVLALAWQSEDAGDVMALVALGEALEAHGALGLAARAYGSILDLFPARADMRRFAAERLDRLGSAAGSIAADAYAKAVDERPDHLGAHRLLAFARLRRGDVEGAFAALEAGLSRRYPPGRFAGGERILREDMGLVGAVWARNAPKQRGDIERRLAAFGAVLATSPSLRFVLSWETDANDVDFHVVDGNGGHAYYQSRMLPSGGELFDDVTTGYGPECFAIQGRPAAYPYRLAIHYYARGPMGYGMGKVEIVEHDGAGNLAFDERPFVVMNDQAFVDLGEVAGPMKTGALTVAR